MTLFPQVRRVRTLGVLIASICFPLGSTMAFAQGTTCTGAPPAPPSAAASVTGQGDSSVPSRIAVSWEGVPTTGANGASTYIVETGSASNAANVAVFDTGSTRYLNCGNGNQRAILRARACGECVWAQRPIAGSRRECLRNDTRGRAFRFDNLGVLRSNHRGKRFRRWRSSEQLGRQANSGNKNRGNVHGARRGASRNWFHVRARPCAASRVLTRHRRYDPCSR